MKNVDLKIDLVYLWCDGSEPQFAAKRKLWEEKLNIPITEYNNDHKYVDHEELRYSLRSIQKNAPWINRIFIVTNGQIPKWLDLTKNDKIKIVTHEEIIPAQYLPTFCSRTIESFIVNIPDLAEHFLLANDDCFISAPVSPSFFFNDKGYPIVRLMKNLMLKKKFKNYLYHKCIKYSNDLINNRYNRKFNLSPHHNIDAYLKSQCIECINEFEKEFNEARKLKFRDLGVQRIIFALYMIVKKKCKVKYIKPYKKYYCKHQDSLYIGIRGFDMFESIKRISPYLLCINDSCRVHEEHLNNFQTFLHFLYPEKCDFEKYDDSEKINMDLLTQYNDVSKKYNALFLLKCKLQHLLRPVFIKEKCGKHNIIRILSIIKIKYRRRPIRKINVGVIGCGVIGGALIDWIENNNSKHCNILKVDPPKGFNDDISNADIIFISIHIPTEVDNSQDLTILEQIIQSCPDVPIYIRTTLKPGTCDMLSQKYNKNVNFMPEFLTERTAREDFNNQPMVFTGHKKLLKKIFVGKEYIVMSSLEAEVTKYAHNVFGALKVTYFNGIYEYCKKLNINYENVHNGILLSGYINEPHTQVPGPDGKLGYGGKCFPKDVNAFISCLEQTHLRKLLAIIPEINKLYREQNIEIEEAERKVPCI